MPDPAKQLQTFADAVRSRVSHIEAQQIMPRLVDEAVTGFAAKGGIAYLEHEGPLPLIFTSGEWTGAAKLTVELAYHSIHSGSLSLGARCNEAEYSARDREVLQHIATVVAQAMVEDEAKI